MQSVLAGYNYAASIDSENEICPHARAEEKKNSVEHRVQLWNIGVQCGCFLLIPRLTRERERKKERKKEREREREREREIAFRVRLKASEPHPMTLAGLEKFLLEDICGVLVCPLLERKTTRFKIRRARMAKSAFNTCKQNCDSSIKCVR